MDENSSLGSIDSEYDMGSVQRDLKFLGEAPSLKEMVLSSQQAPGVTSPFLGLRPANPAMQALSCQKREAHNRSPVSFREGRRASDTSLTQGTPSRRNRSPRCPSAAPVISSRGNGSQEMPSVLSSGSVVTQFAKSEKSGYSDKGFISSAGIVLEVITLGLF